MTATQWKKKEKELFESQMLSSCFHISLSVSLSSLARAWTLLLNDSQLPRVVVVVVVRYCALYTSYIRRAIPTKKNCIVMTCRLKIEGNTVVKKEQFKN